jgi:5-methylcytosine-specific restriction endonuclease McrA
LSAGLPLLCVRVNQARQLTQNLRGHGLKEEVADEIMSRLKECARLLGEREGGRKGASKSKPTRRRVLWRRDPRCFWCGRVTDIRIEWLDKSATVEHLYSRRHPKRGLPDKHLPTVVLACRKCNNERGAPEATACDLCPVIEAERRGKLKGVLRKLN